jgi:hypothetical protein
MAWMSLAIIFSLAAIVSATAVLWVRRLRPHWSVRKRYVIAALSPVTLVILLTALGIAWASLTLPKGGEGGREMTRYVLGIIAIVFAAPALLGGLLGAGLAQGRKAL